MVQRKQKISIKPGKSREPLTITHPNAAGVDIGSSSHYVSVPPDRDDEPVREFPSFTVDLNALADWLDAAASTRSRWNPRACTGSLCSSFWNRAVSKYF